MEIGQSTCLTILSHCMLGYKMVAIKFRLQHFEKMVVFYYIFSKQCSLGCRQTGAKIRSHTCAGLQLRNSEQNCFHNNFLISQPIPMMWPSLKSSLRDDYNEWSHHRVWQRNKKVSILKTYQFWTLSVALHVGPGLGSSLFASLKMLIKQYRYRMDYT